MSRSVGDILETSRDNMETRLISRVKNDHRSKFSNLSNWKEESLKKILFHILHKVDILAQNIQRFAQKEKQSAIHNFVIIP